MTSNPNRKRSVIIADKRTSVCLEDSFWHSLHAIVRIENITIDDFIEGVKRDAEPSNLSSSLRVAILNYFQRLAARNAGAIDARPCEQSSVAKSSLVGRRSNRRARDEVVAYWSHVHGKSAAPL